MIKGIKIDKEGFFISDIIISADEILDDVILIECPNGLYKPRWTGEKWVEGATQEEIEKVKNTAKKVPTTEERIAALEAAMLEVL